MCDRVCEMVCGVCVSAYVRFVGVCRTWILGVFAPLPFPLGDPTLDTSSTLPILVGGKDNMEDLLISKLVKLKPFRILSQDLL